MHDCDKAASKVPHGTQRMTGDEGSLAAFGRCHSSVSGNRLLIDVPVSIFSFGLGLDRTSRNWRGRVELRQINRNIIDAEEYYSPSLSGWQSCWLQHLAVGYHSLNNSQRQQRRTTV
jgi:hypothetical protein